MGLAGWSEIGNDSDFFFANKCMRGIYAGSQSNPLVENKSINGGGQKSVK